MQGKVQHEYTEHKEIEGSELGIYSGLKAIRTEEEVALVQRT
jgi:hypothetical protein